MMANGNRQSRNRLVLFFPIGQRSGASRIVSAARCSSSMKSKATLGLRFRYQAPAFVRIPSLDPALAASACSSIPASAYCFSDHGVAAQASSPSRLASPDRPPHAQMVAGKGLWHNHGHDSLLWHLFLAASAPALSVHNRAAHTDRPFDRLLAGSPASLSFVVVLFAAGTRAAD